ncbi:hypothetical protein L1049_020692 [Liquidambar formosana]|uniref:Transposase MuDR plant domain-containing protein n=1 Tax=Liquidambar formosana TaxID=63359 RepID=A0AAP0S7J4_LIQFO
MTSSGSEDEDFQADPNRFMRGKKPVEDDGSNVSFWVGRVFVSIDAFREKLREYVIQEGFDIVRVKNERTRVTVKCAGEGCQWRIHASPTPDSCNFVVRTLKDEHSCIRSTTNKNASSSWIAKKFASRIKNNPEMKLSGMRNELLEEYGVEVHPMRLYRAKRKCMDAIEGNHGECYGKFPAYADVVRYHNPGSLLKLQCERLHMTSNPSFKNFFVCLEAMKTGFINGCRPFLGLDGCHLKGPYGGVLLGAVALDGNQKLFPVAWAVVDGESKESWRFFLYHLHMGVIDAISEYFPEANQRHCCRHLYNNFKARFPGILLRDHFWDAARACNRQKFNESMDAMKTINIAAYNWLIEIPVTQWSRYAFDARWVGELRSKPVLTMIDTIRCRLMSRTHKRYQTGNRWTNEITPAIMGKLDSMKQKSRTCHTMFARGDEYEVMDGNRRHVARRGTGSAGPSQEPMTQASVNQGSGIGSSNAGGSVLGRGMVMEGSGSACDGGIGRGRGRGRGRAADDVIGRGRGKEGAGGAGRARGKARGRASGMEWPWL